MTSLKAISTLLKKSKFLLSFLFLLVLSSSLLGAESFRVALSGEEESYLSLFSSVLSSFSYVSSDRALTLRREREERNEMKAYLKEKTEESRNETVVEDDGKEEEEYERLELEIVSIDLSPFSVFLSSSDEEAYDYMRNVNDLDGIFYISSEEDGDIKKVSVLFNGDVIHTAWYNSMVEESEKRVIYTLLASLFLGNGHNLYSLEITPSDATLLVDGTSYDGDSSYIILPDGEHVFSLSSYGYKDGVFSLITDGSDDTIALSLEPSERFSLLVTTYPYSASLFFNGVRMDGKYLDSAVTPFVITLENEDFDDYSFQERRQYSRITLSMAPLWTENAALLEEKKNSFYSSLFYVLVSFGGYVASSAVGNYYSSAVGTAGAVLFTGASILSLVNLIQNAVDYYNTAGYGL